MLCEELRKRVLLLDGAMGTMLTHCGRSDGLNLSQPSAVAFCHRRYLEAGVDIVTTNTFTSHCIDGGDANRMRAQNAAGAQIARAEAERMTRLTPDRPRFVLGSVGPIAACEEDYAGQMRILAGEGVDAILVETVIDKDKALLAAAAYDRVCTRCFPPLMISVSPSADGRLLSGESIEDFWKTMEPLHPLSRAQLRQRHRIYDGSATTPLGICRLLCLLPSVCRLARCARQIPGNTPNP